MNQTNSTDLKDDAAQFGALIFEHRRMKKSAVVFTLVPIICLALGIFFIAAGIVATDSVREFVSALVLALIFFACGLPLWIVARRERDLSLKTFSDGLIYQNNNRKTAARWDDVANIFESIVSKSVNGIPAGTFYKYTIELSDGRTIKTSERLAEMETFSRTMRGQLFPRLFVEAVERYNAGGEVKFGELLINKSGIGFRKKFLPLDQLRETQIANGNLRITGADAKAVWATVPLGKIPNNFVLIPLLEDMIRAA